jgi:hypothetical protein
MDCSNCLFSFSPKLPNYAVVKAREMTFFNEGVKVSAMLKPVNDTFYEIVGGKYNGNWVHTFDVIKN